MAKNKAHLWNRNWFFWKRTFKTTGNGEKKNKHCVCSFQTFSFGGPLLLYHGKWEINMCTKKKLCWTIWKCDFWNNKTSKQCTFLGSHSVNLHRVDKNNGNMLPYNATENSNTTSTSSQRKDDTSLASVCVFQICTGFASWHARLLFHSVSWSHTAQVLLLICLE